jgi:hypothetical protein
LEASGTPCSRGVRRRVEIGLGTKVRRPCPSPIDVSTRIHERQHWYEESPAAATVPQRSKDGSWHCPAAPISNPCDGDPYRSCPFAPGCCGRSGATVDRPVGWRTRGERSTHVDRNASARFNTRETHSTRGFETHPGPSARTSSDPRRSTPSTQIPEKNQKDLRHSPEGNHGQTEPSFDRATH